MNYRNISDNHKPHTAASMGSRADLTDRERGVISRLRQRGMKPGRIALRMNICRRTVSRVWKRFQETGSGKRKTRSGRRKKTTARCDRVLRRLALEHRFSSIGRINALWNENIGVETCPRTSKRRLNKMNMHSRIARRKPLTGVVNRPKRVRWCTRIRLWNADDNWSRLVFSDESKFNLDFDDGRVRVWRENCDAMLPRNLVCLHRRSNVSVMVWGCVTVHGVGELVVINGNINKQVYINVLDENLLQSMENTFGDRHTPFIFQHDNAPVHKARNVERWLDQQEIQTIQWPAQSPDLNLIDNLWDHVKKQVQNDRPQNRDELITSIFRSWGDITPNTIRTLYQSMPRRVGAVIRARGYPTKY